MIGILVAAALMAGPSSTPAPSPSCDTMQCQWWVDEGHPYGNVTPTPTPTPSPSCDTMQCQWWVDEGQPNAAGLVPASQAPPAPTTPPEPAPAAHVSVLAYTGVPTGPYAAVALGALLAGAGAVAASRRACR